LPRLSRAYDTRLLALAALGKVKCDLVIKGVALVNVHTKEVQKSVNVLHEGPFWGSWSCRWQA